jgi:drug/metabolite transporter (DMT)-like permease
MPVQGIVLPGLAAAAASVFFGATVVAVRYVIVQTDPLTVALLRHVIGTLLMLPVLLVVARARIPARDLAPIALLGVAMFGLFSYCSAAALEYIYAARGALILTTMPLFTLLLASLFRQERFTALKLTGIALTILGVAVALHSDGVPASGGGLEGRAGSSRWKGDLFMFAASFLGALYNAFSPSYLRRYPALRVTAYSMLAGTLFLLAVSAPAGVFGRFAGFTPLGWGAIFFVGAFGATGGFLLWVWALRRLTPTRVVVFMALNPLAATTLAALLLGERVSAWFLLGLACVLSGIYVVNREREQLRAVAPALQPTGGR